MMLTAASGIATMLILIAAGWIFARAGWYSTESQGFTMRLVIWLSLPAYLLSDLPRRYSASDLSELLPMVPVPFLSMLIVFGLSLLVSVMFRVNRGRRGVLASMSALSNTIFIGLPVNILIFGEESIPFVMVSYAANTTLFWTLSAGLMEADARISRESGDEVPTGGFLLRLGQRLRGLVTVPLLSLFAAVAMIILGLNLPGPIFTAARYLGSMTTPLSMLFLGGTLASVTFATRVPKREVSLFLLFRFLLSPLVLLGTSALLTAATGSRLPVLGMSVLFIQSLMPAMAQTAILARAKGADHELAALLTTLSTILALAVLPAAVAILQVVFHA